MDNKFRVLLLDTKRSNPNHYICLAIKFALSSCSGVEIVVTAELHNAIDKARKNNCDLFFAFDGEELNRTICSRVADVCKLSILWVTEDPYEVGINVANADLFDLIFTNDSASVAAYGEKGRHLPLAGARPFHYLPVLKDISRIRYDVFFAGTAWPNRVELLDKFFKSEYLSAVKAKIALPTNEHLPKFNLPFPTSQLDWRMAPIDFARFANMSLATLVLPRVFSSSDNKDFAETPPPRLFEAALAGTVQLVHSKLAETVDYLEVNKEFLFFDTVSDLESCINNLRNNFEFRYEIALMSQNKVFSSHCYEHRVRYVIDEAQKMKLRSSESKKNKLDLKVKKRIIFVVHNVVEYGNFGGVEVYLKNISQELAHIYEVFFYVPGGPGVSSGAKVLDYVGKVVSNFNFSNIISPWSVSCSEREKAFLTTLVNLKIDLVHFHHLIGHPLSLVGLAKTLGCATVITFHDYYALCHNFNLLSFKGVYCHPEDISLDQCDVCLLNMHHISPGGQAARRSYWDRLLANIDILIFNTHGVRELVSSIYPSVTSHGKKEILSVPIGGSQRPLLKNKRNLSTLKVAILGNFSTHKGGGVIARSIQIMDSSRYEFHIFGRVDSGFAWLVDKNNNPSVHVHGGYSAGELPSLLYECHVSLHLSIWPETYCLTLSEAWDCGLVPIVSDIGALGERVEDGVTGLKITPNSEGALVQALRRLAETPGLLENLKNNIIQISTPRITHHVNELDNLYQSLLSKSFSLGSYASGMNLEALTNNTPIEWANVRNVSQGARRDMYAAPSLRYRLLGLLVRGVGYYKLHGLKSTVGKIQRYIVRRF